MVPSYRLPVAGIGKVLNCLLLAAYCLLLVNCSSKNKTEITDTYICPMHPTVVSDKQGVCPVCNMDLVRKARAGEEVKITEDLARLIKSPNETVVAAIKTTKGEYISVPVSYQAVGVVTYDTRQVFTIPTRVGGRLEKVFLKYPFQPIKKGMKVAEIYSQELVTAQQELFYLLDQKNPDDLLLDGAKSKLRFLGVNESQLNDLIATRKVLYQFSVNSPYDGYIIAETQVAPVTPVPTAMGMSAEPVQPTMNVTELIREGDYVTAGQTLFKVVNTKALRIELNVINEQSKSLQKGDSLKLFLNGTSIHAPVDFIQPFYEANLEFVTIRVNLPNVNVKVGSLVRASWSKSSEAIWIPRQSIVDLGAEQVVFVKVREAFIPKAVLIQSRLNDKVSVQGLSSQDEIATNAQFLVDSEGFIRNANQ
jgi:membrane fusion protein, copper/silver efflux system